LVIVCNNGVWVGKGPLRKSRTGWGSNDYLLRSSNDRLRNILNKYLVLLLSLPLVVIVASVLIVRVFTLIAGTSLASVLRILVVPILVLRSVVSIIKWHATTKLLLEKGKDVMNKLKRIWFLKKANI
jgi:hypothetical protein